MRIILLLFSVALLLTIIEAHAELIPSIEEGALVVRENGKEVIRVGGVPDSLNAQNAYALFKGDIKQATIEDRVGETSYVIDLPCLYTKTKYTDSVITYTAAWVVKKAAPRTEEMSFPVCLQILMFLLIIAYLVFCKPKIENEDADQNDVNR